MDRGRGGPWGQSRGTWRGGGFRGRWRGRGQFNRGWGRGRGKENPHSGGKGGDGQGPGSSRMESVSHGQHNEGPPPPKKKRQNQEQTIKISFTNQLRKLLPGYDLYYWDKVPQLPEFEKKVEAVETFLSEIRFGEDVVQEQDEGVRGFRRESYYSIQFDEAVKNEKLISSWPDINKDLIDEPEETITLWSVTAHKTIHNIIEKEDDKGPCTRAPLVKIGFTKLKPVTPVMNIKCGMLGKFVTIKGAIVRTGNVHPHCQRLTFRCKVCDHEFPLEQIEGKYTPPTVCMSDECTNNLNYLFDAKENAKTTVVIDSRKIRIQDILSRDIERGSVPRTIDCMLFGDLSEQCSTGDAVTLSGVVKMTKDTTHTGEQTLHNMYIEASSIIQHKESESSLGGNLFNFTNKDYYMIKEIHDTPDLFRLLIASLCPSIFGHELVKAGLLLCLFGGTPRDNGIVPRRSDINMLMVGDPGIGKSQMLKVLQEVAPRPIYVCGTGSTTAGLTVTLVKDGDDFSLEAGALVMADRGVCCIDEFDKMSAQHHALLEAMEQQSVSIAKSGVYRTLSARATVIAAANPVGGHYDIRKTVSENIKINPALLSRFDLTFILLDRPDEEFDQKLVDHINSIRGEESIKTPQGQIKQPLNINEEYLNTNLLINRVRIRPGEVFDLIPHSVLRKYIAYAKQYVHPRLSADAAELLKKYYLNLRLSHRGANSTPVTARQLESLVRLTEARAKMELREVATKEDAGDILEIYDFSLSSVFDEEVHAVSALSESVLLMDSSISSGRAKSLVSQAKKLVNALHNVAKKQSKRTFSVDEITQVSAALGFRDKTSSLIATLNSEGFLLKKSAKVYQLQTADY